MQHSLSILTLKIGVRPPIKQELDDLDFGSLGGKVDRRLSSYI